MLQSTTLDQDVVEDVFADNSSVEEISFYEAIEPTEQEIALVSEVISETSDPTSERVFTPTVTAASYELESMCVEEAPDEGLFNKQLFEEKLFEEEPSSEEPYEAGREPHPDAPQAQPEDFQMWGQVSSQFAEMLATWRREELWRTVAPSWEAFVLQHVKLSQSFVNDLCELAERTEAQNSDRVVELEPFIPGSVQQVARRIRQYLRTRPDYQQFSQDSPIGDGTARGHDVDEYSGSYVEFELDTFRVYVWFEYLLPLDGRPHHFSRPWIGSIDFQLCGEGYGEGLYSWLNISQSDIQLRKNASPSTLNAWTNWADALQKELARNFVPAGMAIAL